MDRGAEVDAALPRRSVHRTHGHVDDAHPDDVQAREQIVGIAVAREQLIDIERDYIYELLRDGKITDEARRRIEYELDLEEASLANRRETYGGWL